MSRIFITGSSDGLGQMAACLLIDQGHQVVIHARNESRAKSALETIPDAELVVTGDLSSIAETIHLAGQVNRSGVFDAVIHNAAVGYREVRPTCTIDGLPHVFAINSLAPYILTCLITKPKRLIYISSGLHHDGEASLKDLTWTERPWNGFGAYADSKLHNLILAFAVARIWPDVYSNALEPGWVATKMGGEGAPDSLKEAPETQAWLASSDEQEALVSGKYFFHKKQKMYHSVADDIAVQEGFLAVCEKFSGVKLRI